MVIYKLTKSGLFVLRIIYNATKTNGRGYQLDMLYNATESALLKRGLIAEGRFADRYIVTTEGMMYLNEQKLNLCVECGKYTTSQVSWYNDINCNSCIHAKTSELLHYMRIVSPVAGILAQDIDTRSIDRLVQEKLIAHDGTNYHITDKGYMHLSSYELK